MTVAFESGMILFLLLLVLSLIFSSKMKIHYTLILVVLGLCISVGRYLVGVPPPSFGGEFILGLVLPTLIFQAALSIDFNVLKEVKHRVFLLAIAGVVISALVSTSLLVVSTHLALLAALAFGVIISPTDAASVIDTFKRLGVPKKLSTMLEGEALFNDATAIVLFSAVTSVMLSPVINTVRLATVFGGGVIIGACIAFMAVRIRRVIPNSIYQVALSLAIAYGAYATAEILHFSGVVAVATAGLIVGHNLRDVESKESTVFFWDVAGFMANAVAFLFLGLVADIGMVAKYLPLIIICFMVVLVARFVSVYSILSITSITEEKTSPPWKVITFLGGMRGAVSVALALSLPEGFVRNLIVTLIFGVAFMSLIIQGSILEVYVRRHRLD